MNPVNKKLKVLLDHFDLVNDRLRPEDVTDWMESLYKSIPDKETMDDPAHYYNYSTTLAFHVMDLWMLGITKEQFIQYCNAKEGQKG